MVAGSQSGGVGGLTDGVFSIPFKPVRVWMRSTVLLLRRVGNWPALIGLYLLAAAALLLPWPFGAHPAWVYNWEGYTAWRWETYWEAPVGPVVQIWAPNGAALPSPPITRRSAETLASRRIALLAASTSS